MLLSAAVALSALASTTLASLEASLPLQRLGRRNPPDALSAWHGGGHTTRAKKRGLIYFSSGAASPKPSYSSIVVFGDSYSDNAHPRAKKFQMPPSLSNSKFSDGGRYSNGPVWPEHLANGALGSNITLHDYAYGGAQVSNELESAQPPDTARQLEQYVDQYLTDVNTTKIDRGTDDVLHIFFIGINSVQSIWRDAIAEGATAGNQTARQRASTRITANIVELNRQVSKLKSDTTVTRLRSDILVFTVPPLEIIPYFLDVSKSLAGPKTGTASADLAYIGNLTAAFNSKLTQSITALGPSSTRPDWIRVYDSVPFWSNVKANPSKYNFTDVTDSCISSDGNSECADIDHYEYWDSLHPTTAMHRQFAINIATTSFAH